MENGSHSLSNAALNSVPSSGAEYMPLAHEDDESGRREHEGIETTETSRKRGRAWSVTDADCVRELKSWAWSFPPELMKILSNTSDSAYVRALVRISLDHLRNMNLISQHTTPQSSNFMEDSKRPRAILEFITYVDERRKNFIETERDERRELTEKLRKYDMIALEAIRQVNKCSSEIL